MQSCFFVVCLFCFESINSYERREGAIYLIKPLLVILSPRDIQAVKEAYDKIDYVDKLWIKYYEPIEAYAIAESFFLDYPEYTHIIINCDDAIPQYEHIAMLIADIKKYDFPAIAGCCTVDKTSNDMRLSFGLSDFRGQSPHHQVPNEFRTLNGIVRCWWQGMAYGVIRRDLLEKTGLKGLQNLACNQDLQFSLNLIKLCIPQYIDVRCYMIHARGIGKSFVGEKPKYTILEVATKEVPEMNPAEIVTTLSMALRKIYVDRYPNCERELVQFSYELAIWKPSN